MKVDFHLRRAVWCVVLLCCVCSGVSAAEMADVQRDREKLLMMMSGEWVSRGIYVATKLEVAEHLANGPKSIEGLAQATAAQPEALYRLLHMLSGFGVFEEVSPGVFANTQASAYLAKSNPDSLHALSLFYGEDIHRSWEALLSTIQTGTPAFELAFKQPVFAYFKENPERGALFQEAMKEKSRAVIQSALSSYAFSNCKTVVDVGGGGGQFLCALLRTYPDLQGVLFELPEVIDTVRPRLSQLSTQRCELHAGDFFVSVPTGGDIYLLKSILHDWNDEKCEKILQNCHQAMHPNSRLLIVDVVLQPEDQSVYANCMDVLMLAVTGGKERSLASFKKMLSNTGFELEQVISTATEFSILEARKKS